MKHFAAALAAHEILLFFVYSRFSKIGKPQSSDVCSLVRIRFDGVKRKTAKVEMFLTIFFKLFLAWSRNITFFRVAERNASQANVLFSWSPRSFQQTLKFSAVAHESQVRQQSNKRLRTGSHEQEKLLRGIEKKRMFKASSMALNLHSS